MRSPSSKAPETSVTYTLIRSRRKVRTLNPETCFFYKQIWALEMLYRGRPVKATNQRSPHRGPCLNSETRFVYKRIWVQEMGSFIRSNHRYRVRTSMQSSRRSPGHRRRSPTPTHKRQGLPPSHRAARATDAEAQKPEDSEVAGPTRSIEGHRREPQGRPNPREWKQPNASILL